MFFGWYIVGGTFIAQLFLIGFFTYAVSLLVEPVQAEFGVGLEQVMYSLTAGTFVGLVAMPIGGILIDRYPVRWIMTVGTALFAAGLYALSLSSSIWQYVAIFGITMAVGNALAGSMSATTVISRWFTSSRGRALGISAIGTSVGGVLVPWLFTVWIADAGWRGAVEYLAYCVAFFVLPVVVLTIRGKPEDINTLPEGGHEQQVSPGAEIGEQSSKDIIANPGYWYIGLTLGLLFCVYTAILANITPYATGQGVSTEAAASLIMAVAVMGFVGKLIFGFVADKVNLKFGLWAALGLVCTGFLILAAEPPYWAMLAACCCLGLAAGGQLPVWGAMMAKVFGLVSYGRAMGLMGPLITLLVMPGFSITGMLVDMTGSYQLCLLAFSGVTVLAALLLFPLKLGDEPIQAS